MPATIPLAVLIRASQALSLAEHTAPNAPLSSSTWSDVMRSGVELRQYLDRLLAGQQVPTT